jgi:hypothetical protein
MNNWGMIRCWIRHIEYALKKDEQEKALGKQLFINL